MTKLVERCFISDLALVSSPGVACGFRYDSNHRVQKNSRRGNFKVFQWVQVPEEAVEVIAASAAAAALLPIGEPRLAALGFLVPP